jgi:hypothetical protein
MILFFGSVFTDAALVIGLPGLLFFLVGGRHSSQKGKLPPGHYYICKKCGFNIPVHEIGKYKR